jgi:GNAT superfamily N-acetyltransferase
MSQASAASKMSDVLIQQLREEDLQEANRIVRVAFGTFLGLPDPMQTFGDRDMIVNRWRANRSSVFGAYLDRKLVGSNVVTKWGTFGWFGPLTVSPDLWNTGVAKKLLEPTMDIFSKWQTTHEGLFTFAHSPKHVSLYQKFGFYPRFLTAIMSKKIEQGKGQKGIEEVSIQFETFSKFTRDKDREDALKECQDLTNSIYEGLDVSNEIRAVYDLKLGDTVIVRDDSRIAGFAICHFGPNTEGGSGNCFIKFGAAVSKPKFRRLLNACKSFASTIPKVETIEAGVNLARSEAYWEMISFGFRTEFQGVAMQKPANEAGYNRPEVFVIDDWR